MFRIILILLFAGIGLTQNLISPSLEQISGKMMSWIKIGKASSSSFIQGDNAVEKMRTIVIIDGNKKPQCSATIIAPNLIIMLTRNWNSLHHPLQAIIRDPSSGGIKNIQLYKILTTIDSNQDIALVQLSTQICIEDPTSTAEFCHAIHGIQFGSAKEKQQVYAIAMVKKQMNQIYEPEIRIHTVVQKIEKYIYLPVVGENAQKCELIGEPLYRKGKLVGLYDELICVGRSHYYRFIKMSNSKLDLTKYTPEANEV